MKEFFTKKIIVSLIFLLVIFLGVTFYVEQHKKVDISLSNFKSFSINPPADYARDGKYKYQELGPGKDITGVKFTIPASLAKGTNLSTDSYISVEEIPQVPTCDASLFLEQSQSHIITDGGIIYSKASFTGAAMGNRYDETVYALPDTRPCLAIRYFIHYSVFENYPPGAVKQFDEKALLNQFDMIRRSLVVNR